MAALGIAPIPPLHLFALTNHVACKIHIQQPKGEALPCLQGCKRSQYELDHSGHCSWSTQLHIADKTSRITLLGRVVLPPPYPGWLVPTTVLGRMLQHPVIQCLLQRGPCPSCTGLFRHFLHF